MASPLVIAVDCSTTAAKAIVVDATGALVGTGAQALDTQTPAPHWFEQHAPDWWAATDGAVQQALGEIDDRSADRSFSSSAAARAATARPLTRVCTRQSCGASSGPFQRASMRSTSISRAPSRVSFALTSSPSTTNVGVPAAPSARAAWASSWTVPECRPSKSASATASASRPSESASST